MAVHGGDVLTASTIHSDLAAALAHAHEVFETGARLPERVDAVMETVGAATWSHSLKSLRPGGRVVVAGATTGPAPPTATPMTGRPPRRSRAKQVRRVLLIAILRDARLRALLPLRS